MVYPTIRLTFEVYILHIVAIPHLMQHGIRFMWGRQCCTFALGIQKRNVANNAQEWPWPFWGYYDRYVAMVLPA